MSYETGPKIKKRIDEINQEINEQIKPIVNATDATAKEIREGVKREKALAREVKELDKDYWLTTFGI